MLGVADLCGFLGAHLENVLRMRVLRDEAPDRYVALLEFASQAAADLFFLETEGRPFFELDPSVRAVLAYARGVFFDRREIPADEEELPTCPVCLERLEPTLSGVLTVQCNHSFHAQCLRRWRDHTCPVCRCAQAPLDEPAASCSACGLQHDLWICLVCGHVGCGRYAARHAVQHFAETRHAYALEVGTDNVWDYVGDGYVHRLLTSTSADDKLVAMDAKGVDTGSDFDGARGGAAAGGSGGGGGGGGGVAGGAARTCAAEERSLLQEYNAILVTQLDTQRSFFEQRMRELREQAASATRHVRRVEGQLSAAQARVQTVSRERDELRQLNEQLMRNLAATREQSRVEASEARTRIAALEDQLRDLMTHIAMQDRLATSGVDRGELEGGTVHAVASPASTSAGGGGRGGTRRGRR